MSNSNHNQLSFRRESLSLKDLADILFRQKWLVLSGIFAIGCAIAACALLSKPRYDSEMLILVKNDRPEPVLTGAGPTGAANRSDVTDAQIATEVEMLSNQDLLTRVVRKCNLVPAASAANPQALEAAVGSLRKHLHITPGVRSNLIKISYSSEHPEQSAAVLRALMGEYVETNLQMHRAAGSSEFFRTQAARYATELHDAQARMADFEVKTKVVALDEQKDLRLRKLADLEASLVEAQTAEREGEERNHNIRTQIAALSERVTTQMRHMPNQYSVERLNTMLVDLRNKRTERLVKFRPDDRMIKEVDDQIQQTEAALASARASESNEEATDVNPVRQTLQSELLAGESRLQGLKARVTALGQNVQAYRQDLDQLGLQTGTHDELARAVKEAESRYLLYSRQLEEAELATQMDQRRISNLAVAEQPRVPSTAHARIDGTALFGGVLGLVLWHVLLIFRGMRRSVVFTPWELEGVLAIPVLGSLPLESRRPLLVHETSLVIDYPHQERRGL